MIVHLADDARAHIVTPVKQLLLDLIFDDLATLFDDENLFEPDCELPYAVRLQRPRHADLIKPQTDFCSDLFGDAEFAQRLPHILITLAGRHDPEARIRRIHRDAVDLVGARECNRCEALVVLQSGVLIVAIIRPAQVQSALRHLEIGRYHELLHLVGKVDLGRRLNSFGNDFHADPATGIARHRDTQKTHLDDLVDRGRVKVRHERRHERVVGLMRDRRGFGAVVVAGET